MSHTVLTFAGDVDARRALDLVRTAEIAVHFIIKSRHVSVRRAAAKKEGFLPPNKTKRLFFRAAVETTWTNEKKEALFPRLIRQNP